MGKTLGESSRFLHDLASLLYLSLAPVLTQSCCHLGCLLPKCPKNLVSAGVKMFLFFYLVFVWLAYEINVFDKKILNGALY